MDGVRCVEYDLRYIGMGVRLIDGENEFYFHVFEGYHVVFDAVQYRTQSR